MSDRGAIERLASIALAFDEGRPVSPDDVAWFAAGVVRQLAGKRAMSLDQAIGAAAGPGERSARTVLGIRRRNQAIRELARRHLPSRSVAEQADEISRMARRYQVTAWRHDRHLGRPPDAYRGAPRELLFAAFNFSAVPLSPRQIRRILSP